MTHLVWQRLEAGSTYPPWMCRLISVFDNIEKNKLELAISKQDSPTIQSDILTSNKKKEIANVSNRIYQRSMSHELQIYILNRRTVNTPYYDATISAGSIEI